MSSDSPAETHRDGDNGETSPRVVEIQVGPRLAIVQPAVEAVIAPILTYREQCFDLSGKGGRRNWTREQRFCKRLEGNRLVIPAGALERAERELRKRGYQTRIQDLRELDREEYRGDAEFLETLPRAEQQYLTIVENKHQGLVVVPPGRLRIHLIGITCRFYRGCKILVPCATVKEANDVAAGLLEYVGGNVDSVRKSTWNSYCRVVCCTFWSARHCSNPGEWGLLIFPNGDEAISESGRQACEEFVGNRVFAFVAPTHHRGDRSRLRLEALAGPEIYRVPSLLGQPASVRVLVADGPWSPSLGELSALERKRHAYRNNDPRNEKIADLARGLAERDITALWRSGLCLHENTIPVTCENQPRVLVMVESVEHGRCLQKLLPDWRLLHAEPSNQASRPLSWADVAPAAVVSHQAVVTTVRAEQLARLDVDALVVASGGSGAAIPSWFPPQSIGGQTRQVLLVDVADDFDPTAREWTRRRLQDYHARGFQVDVPRRWQEVRSPPERQDVHSAGGT